MIQTMGKLAVVVMCLSACSSNSNGAPTDDAGRAPVSDASVADSSDVDASDAAHAADAAHDSNDLDAGREPVSDASVADAGDADASDASTVPDAATDADASTTCTVSNDAPTISSSSSSSSLPTLQGGAIVSGTYYLTGYVWHQGTQDCPLQTKRTAVFRADTSTKGVRSEISETPGVQNTLRCSENQPYETSGNHLVGPDGGVSSATFEATDTTIQFAIPDSGSCGGVLMTYTKAP